MIIPPEVKEFYKSLPENHVLSVLFAEHELILEIMINMKDANSQLQKLTGYNEADDIIDELQDYSKILLDTESHLLREEVVFKEMIVKNIVGPPRVMIMEHEMLLKNKNIFYNIMNDYSSFNWNEFKIQVNDLCIKLYYKLWDHMQRENEEIFPKAYELINDDDLWDKMSDECDKIGYELISPSNY